MKFGLFFNPQIPKALGETDWDADRERTRFAEMCEQVELADRLGFDYVFVGEHHFTAEYAHNSSPEVLLGALSRTTKNIRLCTGIVHMSHNDPVRTAERIATIDILSGGRVEFGMGEGSPSEIRPFVGDDVNRTRERTAAAMQIAVDVLSERGMYPGYQGDFFDYPPVNVVPKSYQRPHPPLWMSSTRMEGGVYAAQRGMGNLVLTAGGADDVRARVEAYWNTLRTDCTPIGKAVNAALFTFANGIVAPTEQQAWDRAREGLEFFAYGLIGGSAAGMADPNAHLYQEFTDYKAGTRDRRQETGMPEQLLQMGAAFPDSPGNLLGSAQTAREKVAEFEETGADAMLFTQMMGWTKHEHLMESIEILGTEVFPEFRKGHARHQEWRKKQLVDFPFPVNASV